MTRFRFECSHSPDGRDEPGREVCPGCHIRKLEAEIAELQKAERLAIERARFQVALADAVKGEQL